MKLTVQAEVRMCPLTVGWYAQPPTDAYLSVKFRIMAAEAAEREVERRYPR